MHVRVSTLSQWCSHMVAERGSHELLKEEYNTMKTNDMEEVSRTLSTSAPLWIRVPDIGKKYHNEIEAEEDGTKEARDDVFGTES